VGLRGWEKLHSRPRVPDKAGNLREGCNVGHGDTRVHRKIPKGCREEPGKGVGGTHEEVVEGVRIPRSPTTQHSEGVAVAGHRGKGVLAHEQLEDELLGDDGRHFGPESDEAGPVVPPSSGSTHPRGQPQPLRHLQFPILSSLFQKIDFLVEESL